MKIKTGGNHRPSTMNYNNVMLEWNNLEQFEPPLNDSIFSVIGHVYFVPVRIAITVIFSSERAHMGK